MTIPETPDSLGGDDTAAVTDLFDQECYWRDLVSFTWNISTQEGRDAIRAATLVTAPLRYRSAARPVGADNTAADARPIGWRN